MNVRFVVRGALLAVGVVLAATVAVLLFTEAGRRLLPPGMPAAPHMTVPRGELPPAPVCLVEQAFYQGSEYYPVGRGFFLALPDGARVGITTAHSVSLGPLQRIAFAQHEYADRVIAFDTLHGEPGLPRWGEDMSVDYILLSIPSGYPLDPALILEPDPRGLPQPGERVSMYTMLHDQPRILEGGVLSVAPTAVWVVMDEAFDPSGLSGSPFISQHTGRVVGMTIATTRQGGKVLLGLHPIGSIVEKALAAKAFPKIADYRR